MDAKKLLETFLGAAGTGGASGGGLDRIAGGLSGRGGLGGLAGGALAGGLASVLLGGGRKPKKLAKTALKYGGMALVAGLAWKAYRDWQAGRAPPSATPLPPGAELPRLPSPSTAPEAARFAPSDEAAAQDLSRALLRAMIAAAKSDGHIDAAEQARIFARLDDFDLDAEDKAFVMDELRRPLDIDAVAAAATSPEAAAEIYAASLLAIDPDTPAERGYLQLLAARLGLDPALAAHLEAGAAAAREG
jgi:uncharacterized membrane protein YebE (DUF533 family)